MSMLSICACNGSFDANATVACNHGSLPKMLLASIAKVVWPNSAAKGVSMLTLPPSVCKVAANHPTSLREGWLFGISNCKRLLGKVAAIPSVQ